MSVQRLLIFTCFFLLVGLGLLFTSASTALAQSVPVGTHIGEGDINAQIDIINNVLRPNGAGAGFPVTLMVSTKTPDGEVAALAAAAEGLAPILRINDACDGTSPAAVVSSIQAHFGDVPIEFGNEINNPELECASPSNYVSAYSSISGSAGTIGPSALDWYNANYPAASFLSSIGSIYQGKVYFANAYGCVGTNAAGCDVAGTDTQVQGYQDAQGRGSFFLTEFSLSPEGRSSDAPDTDLAKVVEFIKTRADSTGAVAITPLIRNVCNSTGDWLLYVNGEVFDKSGRNLTQSCIPGEDDKDAYYLYPIKGVLNGDEGAIWSDLLAQGYQSYCTVPKIDIEATDNLNDQLRKDTHDNNRTEFTSSQEYNYRESEIPIWRNLQEAGIVTIDAKNSLEGYWSHRDTTEDDPLAKDLASAPIYRLLTLEQQCQQQVYMLETIEKKCNTLQEGEPRDRCALDIEITDTEYEALDLLDAWRNSGLSCTDVGEGNYSADQEPIITGLSHTPLTLPKAFRLAFLVVTAELGENKDRLGSPSLPIFSFLRFPRFGEPNDEPKHEVRVIAFKVPDFGTNRDPDDESTYQDALQLTRDSLLTLDQQEQREQRIADYKADEQPDFINDIYYSPGLSPEREIQCEGTEACSSALIKALVTFVNKRNKSGNSTLSESYCAGDPSAYPYEPSSEISSVGGLEPSGGAVHQLEGEQGDTLAALRSQWAGDSLPITTEETDQFAPGTEPLPFNFFSHFNFKYSGVREIFSQYNPQREARLDSYLVYPQGFELQEVERTLAGIIYTQPEVDQFFAVDSNLYNEDVIDHFKITETGMRYVDGEGEGEDIIDQACRQVCDQRNAAGDFVNVEGGYGACLAGCTVTPLATVTADEGDHEPRILGGVLGKLMRNIQLNLRVVGSKGYNYIASCKTTEEFLLGKCSGNYSGGVAAGTSEDIAAGHSTSQCIEVWVDGSDANRYANRLRSNLLWQQQPSDSFAGWAAYYRGTPENQFLFGTCGGQRCYDYIIDQVLAQSDINPYLAIAIALNETGGLISNNPDGSGPHFGCAPGRHESIEIKLQCMIDTLNNYRTRDTLNDNEALEKYGYVGGYNNSNLNKIIGILSNFTYDGVCSAQNTPPAASTQQ